MNRLVKTIIDEGVKIWYQWNDLHIGQRIALGKYEPYLTRLVLESVDKNSVFVDVGANIGYYSLLSAKKGAVVWAIEPDENNFAILEKNVKENGLEGKIKLVKAGAGSKNSWAKMERSEVNFGAHKLMEGQAPAPPQADKRTGLTPAVAGQEKIKIIRLDDVIKEKVEVIKIDVEGMEAEVVAGARKLIKKWKPTIFFEYGVNLRNGGLLNFLSKIYGGIFVIDEYAQFYRLAEVKKLKNYEGNLMVKKNLGWEWGQVKDVDWKKVIKKILSYNGL